MNVKDNKKIYRRVWRDERENQNNMTILYNVKN